MIDVLVDVAAQMEQDAGRDRREVIARDRAVVKQHASVMAGNDVVRKLKVWVREVGAEEGERESDRIVPGLWAVAGLIVVLAFVLGASVAGAVFLYDGGHPVNVTRVLWVFFVLPLLLLVLLVLALLPVGWLRAVPPLKAWWVLASRVNVGGLWQVLAKLLPQETRQALERAMGQSQAQGRLHGRLHRMVLLRWSQAGALAFQVGAVSALLMLVTVEDRAFSWSTQVGWVAEHYTQIVQGISAPWRWALPVAGPVVEVVESTRYVRAEGGVFVNGEPSAKMQGAWWPFVLMCMVVYGVVPRVVTYGYTVVASRRAARWSLLHLPRIDDVLDRLDGRVIETTGEQPGDDLASVSERETAYETRGDLPSSSQAVLDWAGTLGGRTVTGFAVAGSWEVGGSRTLAQDRAAMEDAGAKVKSGEARGVTVTVPAFESPTLDVMDALSDLRSVLGDGVMVTLAAVMKRGEDSALNGVASWEREAAKLGDPWLRVSGLEVEDA